MARFENVLLCAAVAFVFWTMVGLPIAARITDRVTAALIAPALGWAVFSALALPFFNLIHLGRGSAVALGAAVIIAAGAALRRQKPQSLDPFHGGSLPR